MSLFGMMVLGGIVSIEAMEWVCLHSVQLLEYLVK